MNVKHNFSNKCSKTLTDLNFCPQITLSYVRNASEFVEELIFWSSAMRERNVNYTRHDTIDHGQCFVTPIARTSGRIVLKFKVPEVYKAGKYQSKK